MSNRTAATADDKKETAKRRTKRPVLAVITPRLLDKDAACVYLGGISDWTLETYVADKHIKPVALPSTKRKGETSRRLLFDIHDLDRFIERQKQ